MELLVVIVIIVVAIVWLGSLCEKLGKSSSDRRTWPEGNSEGGATLSKQYSPQEYYYSRKDEIMTNAEWRF